MRGLGLLKFIVSLAVVLAAGGIGSLATAKTLPTWYEGLVKPRFNPPEWLFGPAWTALYLLMAVAAWLVWKRGFSAPGVRLALAAFLLQLVLNALWSVFFFGLRSPLYGLVDILLLWLAILGTIVLFFRVSVPAGVLLLPYIGWVTFATILNAAILSLNRR
ncbi:MAG TPA: TspO/MBR family protein [bacterium]|nr:TspO/MBR family protein [bacterium]